MGINFQSGKRIVVDLSDLHFPSLDDENKLNTGLVIDLIEIDGVYFESTPERRQMQFQDTLKKTADAIDKLRQKVLIKSTHKSDDGWIYEDFQS